MRVLVDGLVLSKPEANRGIGIAFKKLLAQMVLDDLTIDWWIAVRHEFDLDCFAPHERDRLRPVIVDNPSPGAAAEAATAQISAQLQAAVDAHGIDAYWNANPLMDSAVLPTGLSGVEIFVTLYDLTPLVLRQQFLDTWPASVKQEYLRRLKILPEWATHLLCISHSSRNDYMAIDERVAGKSSVVHLAVDHSQFQPLLAPRADDERYVLYTGGFAPQKNMDGALAGFAALVASSPAEYADLKFCVVCSSDEATTASYRRQAAQLNVADRLVVTGFVDAQELVRLYQHASVLFFPSFYEGFGLPVLEAMACGVPVVASNNSSLPEIGGDLAEYCDPHSTESMAQALTRALANRGDQQQRQLRIKRARSFTWAAAARAYTRAFKRGRKFPTIHVHDRPRVAMATPWPEQRTGVASYTQLLTAKLREHLDLTLYVEKPAECGGERFGLPMRPLGELLEHRGEYDATLYQVGNNTDYHREIYKLAYDHPGIVVLHDYNLLGMFGHGFGTGEDSSYLQRAALDGYGIESEPFRPREILRRNLPMSHALVKRSQATIVHSRFVKEQLAGLADVYVVPHHGTSHVGHYDAAAKTLRARLGIPENQFIVSTLGYVNRLKRVPSILKAVHTLRAAGYPIHVLIAGSVNDETSPIRPCIESLGLEPHVTITGYLSEVELHAAIAISDVVLNLRCPSMGETSGTLLQAFGHAKACIVSDYEQFADFPPTICWKAAVDDVEIPELVALLEHLLGNPGARRQLGQNALEWLENHSSREVAAEGYADVVRRVIDQQHACRTSYEIPRAVAV